MGILFVANIAFFGAAVFANLTAPKLAGINAKVNVASFVHVISFHLIHVVKAKVERVGYGYSR